MKNVKNKIRDYKELLLSDIKKVFFVLLLAMAIFPVLLRGDFIRTIFVLWLEPIKPYLSVYGAFLGTLFGSFLTVSVFLWQKKLPDIETMNDRKKRFFDFLYRENSSVISNLNIFFQKSIEEQKSSLVEFCNYLKSLEIPIVMKQHYTFTIKENKIFEMQLMLDRNVVELKNIKDYSEENLQNLIKLKKDYDKQQILIGKVISKLK